MSHKEADESLELYKKEHIHTQLAVKSDIILRSRTWES